jgi:formate C-acetyltransferase
MQSLLRTHWRPLARRAFATKIDVEGFVRQNVTPYAGDEMFLKGATERTKTLWDRCLGLLKVEHEKG